MTLEIPAVVARYLAAEEARNAAELSACFAEDGAVHDEGRDHRGHDAIRRWKQNMDAKYRYVVQPVAASSDGDIVTVLGRVTGDFPGSPVELNFVFRVAGGRISSLEIRS